MQYISISKCRYHGFWQWYQNFDLTVGISFLDQNHCFWPWDWNFNVLMVVSYFVSFIFSYRMEISTSSIQRSFILELWYVRIEPLKAWHDVNLEFIIYLMMFQFHFYLSLFHVLYFMSMLVCIFCIIHELGTLRIAQKI